MVQRFLITVVTAAALLVPSAAISQAYGPPSSDMEISDPTPLAGEPFVVEIEGPAGSEATLQIVSQDPTVPDSAIAIAGVKALTKVIPSSGAAAFTVTLAEPGTYTLTALVDGVVTEVQTVRVLAVGVGGEVLSDTGFSALPLVASAAGLVLVGGAGLVIAKRRHREM